MRRFSMRLLRRLRETAAAAKRFGELLSKSTYRVTEGTGTLLHAVSVYGLIGTQPQPHPIPQADSGGLSPVLPLLLFGLFWESNVTQRCLPPHQQHLVICFHRLSEGALASCVKRDGGIRTPSLAPLHPMVSVSHFSPRPFPGFAVAPFP